METSRTKKVIRNVKYNFMNQFLVLVLSFVSRTVFIQYIGIEYLGINGLFSDVLGLLSLADLGLNTAMVYSYYEPLANNDKKKLAALTTFYRKVYRYIAITITTVGCLLIPFIDKIVNLETEVQYLRWYYLLALLNVTCSYLWVYKTSILTADQKSYKLVRINMIFSLTKSLMQISAIVLFQNYFIYLFTGLVFVLMNNWIASCVAVKEYSFLNERVELDLCTQKKIFINIKSVFIYKIAGVLLTATDNILISTLVGTIAVGYASNYTLLQTKLAMFYTLFFSAFTASLGNIIVRENEEKRYQVFQHIQIISSILSIILVPCFILLVSDFIMLWLGNAYLLNMNVVFALGINLYMGCILQPLLVYRDAAGLYQKTKYIMVICAALNIIYSIIGGYFWGIAGILFASALSRICTYIWYEPKVLFTMYFKRKPWGYYKNIGYNIFIMSLAISCSYKVTENMIISSWIDWILKGVIIGILCLVINVVFYFRNENCKWFLNELRRRVLG